MFEETRQAEPAEDGRNGQSSSLGGAKPALGGEAITARFVAWSRRSPHSVALEHEGAQVSYADLERKSRALALSLARRGLAAGDRVAVLAERGPELIIAMLAVLRLGGAFVVLDRGYPDGRLETLLGLAAPKALLAAHAGLLDAARALGNATGVPALLGEPGHERPPSDIALDEAAPGGTAYLLFTSGSTGTPKCIACHHTPLVHFVDWHERSSSLTAEDRFSMLSGLSHDPMLRDIFTPLSIGATLVIPRQATITEPGQLRRWFAASGVTVSHLTPAMGQLLTAGGTSGPTLPAMRRFFWGGDHLYPALLAKVAAVAPQAIHTNFYGCTETPQAVSHFRYDGQGATDAGKVPIGRATAGFQLDIVDETRAPIGDGTEGEIAVTSHYLSLGYFERGALLPPQDRGQAEDGRPVYYTGDRGVRLPTGDILLLGRADDQLKVRGYRVNLSEITAAMLAIPGVANAIALAMGPEGSQRIEAFVAFADIPPDAEAMIAARIGEKLPGYMIPGRVWTFARELPLLPNGKIDRKALQAHVEQAEATPRSVEGGAGHANEAEAALAAQWAEILKVPSVSREQSFVRLGGDSLSYVEAYLALEDLIGEPPKNWPELTIAQLCARAPEAGAATGGRWSAVDVTMAIRAFAIALIVAYHFRITEYGNGLTGALLLVSGYLLTGMQIREVFSRGSPAPLLNSFKNVLIPTFFFTWLTIGVDVFYKHEIPPLASFLLSTDLIDVRYSGIAARDGVFWYVHGLIKILLALYVAAWLLPTALRTPERRRGFVYTLFAAGCFGRFVLPAFFVPDFWFQGTHDLSVFALSPTSNIATFLLGAVLAEELALGRRWRALAIAAAFAGLDAVLYGGIHGAGIAGAAALLLFTARIRMPKLAARLTYGLAGASLYIYTTHMIFASLTTSLTAGVKWPMLQFVIAMAGGVAVHAAWRKAGSLLATLRARRPLRIVEQ